MVVNKTLDGNIFYNASQIGTSLSFVRAIADWKFAFAVFHITVALTTNIFAIFVLLQMMKGKKRYQAKDDEVSFESQTPSNSRKGPSKIARYQIRTYAFFIADCIFAIFVILASNLAYFINWPLGNYALMDTLSNIKLCRFRVFCLYSSMQVSAWIGAFINIDRILIIRRNTSVEPIDRSSGMSFRYYLCFQKLLRLDKTSAQILTNCTLVIFLFMIMGLLLNGIVLISGTPLCIELLNVNYMKFYSKIYTYFDTLGFTLIPFTISLITSCVISYQLWMVNKNRENMSSKTSGKSLKAISISILLQNVISYVMIAPLKIFFPFVYAKPLKFSLFTREIGFFALSEVYLLYWSLNFFSLLTLRPFAEFTRSFLVYLVNKIRKRKF